MRTHLVMPTALCWLASVTCAEAAPQRITVPAHLEYCVTSKPLDAEAYALPEVRNQLFDLLYHQIEQEALRAGLPSVGVPFVDDITRTEATPPAPAAGGAAPNATYVVRQCVVVPNRGTPSLPAEGLKEVPERVMYASLCWAAEFEACKREIEKMMLQGDAGTVPPRPIVWRTRPALTRDDTTDNLVASMSDASVRILKDSAPKRQVPGDVAVIAGEWAPAPPSSRGDQ